MTAEIQTFSATGQSTGSRLVSINHTAKRLGLSRRTVYRMIDRGELPLPVKVGTSTRFFAEDIDRFLEELRLQNSA